MMTRFRTISIAITVALTLASAGVSAGEKPAELPTARDASDSPEAMLTLRQDSESDEEGEAEGEEGETDGEGEEAEGEGSQQGSTLQRGNRMEFDARLVRGERAGSGAVFLFQRVPRPLPSMVDKRSSFLGDSVEDTLGARWKKKFDSSKQESSSD